MINVLAGIIKAKGCGLKLIVMDEPLNNLDGRNKDILNTLIKELRAEGVKIPIVGASDCHNVVSELFDKFFTYAFAEDVSKVKEAVMSFNSVAVEKVGNEYRVYGPFRLVKYARFLCDNLEPEIKAIRKGTASKIAEAIEKV